MTGMAERLTYLLGICIAVISWSVTQLNASFGDNEVIGYRIETKAVDDRWDATTLHLENLSKTKVTERITVSAAVNTVESDPSLTATRPGFGTIRLCSHLRTMPTQAERAASSIPASLRFPPEHFWTCTRSTVTVALSFRPSSLALVIPR